VLQSSAGVQKEAPYRVSGLDLVFCQYNGRPLDPDGVSHRFKAAARAAGFPDMRLHDLRHNFASWMLADSEKIHVVQELLGHEKASTTEDIYAEAMPGSHKGAVDRFDEKYGSLINTAGFGQVQK
jgi:integrase